MLQLNPDPHKGGYVYVPRGAVTAFFQPGQDIQPLLRVLSEAGFSEDRIEVFTGKEGLERLDPEGVHHGLWVRFRRGLEETYGEGYEAFENAYRILQAGGSVVAVFTLKDKDKKARVAELLKAHHGQDVVYWGPWVREFF